MVVADRRSAISLGWFHRYPARFSTESLAAILEIVKPVVESNGVVVDPFAGCGSTMAAARQRGIRSVGVELSRLGVLIADVRLNPPTDPEAILERAETWAVGTVSQDVPVDASLVSWLGEENSRVLAGLLGKLESLEDSAEKRWLSLALSSALRPASVWLPGSIKPQIDPNRSPPSIQSQFRRAAKRLYRDTRREAHGQDVPASILKGDARCLPFENATVDAVVTSPPYWTMYDYFDVQRLTYLAFEWPQERHLQVGRAARISPDGHGFQPPEPMVGWYQSLFRGEATIQGRALRAYLVDMHAHVNEALRVLRPDGVAVYAMADSHRRGHKFELVATMCDILRTAGFKNVQAKPRPTSNRRILPAGRDPLTGRFSSNPDDSTTVTEHLIVARRP